MKIVFLDRATLGQGISLSAIERLGDYYEYESTSPEQIIDRIKDASIVIVNKVVIGKEQMDSAPLLRLICVAATGMNNIDLKYASERDIAVRNAVNYSSESVAQTTFSALLALIGHISYFDKCVKSGKYSLSPHFTDTGRSYFELSGKRFGVIGMGNIGKRVAAIASAFGSEVVYSSTSGAAHCDDYKHIGMDELLATSDIISIHSPLNDKTDNLIDYRQICKMKSSAIIVNMGRGGIVNEADLAKALNEDNIAGAVVDVYTKEPLPSDHPYLKVDNPEKLILTPHIAWASVEARERLVAIIAANIEKYLQSAG